MLIKIKSWSDGSVLFTGEYPDIKKALEDAVKNRASLDGASLVCARLDGASLVCASLDGASLDGASLDRASLDGASLDGASLDRASLVGASLDRARLDGASLVGARLDGASLDRASLDKKHCFLSIFPIGSENGCLWVMRGKDGVLKYNRGCFCGTESEFIEAIKNKHAGTEHEKKYLAAVEFIKIQLGE